MDEITKKLKELDEFEESDATETDYNSLLEEVKSRLKKARKELVDYRKNKGILGEDRELEIKFERKVEELGKKVEELKKQREISEQKILIKKLCISLNGFFC